MTACLDNDEPALSRRVKAGKEMVSQQWVAQQLADELHGSNALVQRVLRSQACKG